MSAQEIEAVERAMTLDIEGVLAGHYTYAAGRGLTVRCKCGAVVGERGSRTGIGNSATHRAHVAAVLREQIAAAQAEAWERGYRRGGSDRITSEVTLNPYRAAQVAPSRVPGEGS